MHNGNYLQRKTIYMETNHVLHYEYTSTGENLPFLEEEYEVATETEDFK